MHFTTTAPLLNLERPVRFLIMPHETAKAAAAKERIAREMAISDLASLGHLARGGSLDLTAVAMRVRTDLLVSTQRPLHDDIISFMEFAQAVLPALGERDIMIVSQKLAGWPHTPHALKESLSALFPPARDLFFPRPVALELEEPASPKKTIPHVAMDVDTAAMQHDVQPVPGPLQDAGLSHTAEAWRAVAENEMAGEAASGHASTLDHQIVAAMTSLAQGDKNPAQSLLARSDLRAADHAPFFLVADQVQQSLILSGLEQLQRLEPRRILPRQDKATLDALMEAAAHDRAGAFLGLAHMVGGSPEFAAAMTLDTSRKLAGLSVLAAGGSVEDAVRFAIKLGDEFSASVQVIFGLADTLRAATPATAFRLVRAIAGPMVAAAAPRAARHVPVADPSGTPDRTGQSSLATPDRRGTLSPHDIARKLAGNRQETGH